MAELPPHVYAEEQNSADSALEIEVQSSSLDWCFWCDARDVELKVKILKINRSKLKLRIGQVVTIRYRHAPYTKGEVGPSPIPILKTGFKGPAYLNRSGVNYKDGIIFKPAAGGYSFQELDS